MRTRTGTRGSRRGRRVSSPGVCFFLLFYFFLLFTNEFLSNYIATTTTITTGHEDERRGRRRLETRFDVSRASLIYVPSYHHHVDERECERGQGWGQMRTQGRGRGHVRGSRRVSSPGMSFFRVFFFFIFTDDLLTDILHEQAPLRERGTREASKRVSRLPPSTLPFTKEEELRTRQNVSRSSLFSFQRGQEARDASIRVSCMFFFFFIYIFFESTYDYLL